MKQGLFASILSLLAFSTLVTLSQPAKASDTSTLTISPTSGWATVDSSWTDTFSFTSDPIYFYYPYVKRWVYAYFNGNRGTIFDEVDITLSIPDNSLGLQTGGGSVTAQHVYMGSGFWGCTAANAWIVREEYLGQPPGTQVNSGVQGSNGVTVWSY